MPELGPVAWPPAPILTERLVLRATEARDRAAYVDLLSSEQVHAHLGGARSRDELERAVPRVPGSHAGVFAVELAGAMVGTVTFDRRGAERPGHVRVEGDEVEVGYLFLPEAWGHGYATEAARALLQWAFDTLDLNRVQAETDTRNAASARVLEKLGFVCEGTLREDCVVNGEVSDSWVYGLLRREWRQSSDLGAGH